MIENSKSSSQTSHKEEAPSRILADNEDRMNICKKLNSVLNPLDVTQNQHNLVNIVIEKVIPNTDVDVYKAIDIGTEQMKQFESEWPGGFYKPIKKIVKTMAERKKH